MGTVLTSSPIAVQTPYILVTIGNYKFGAYNPEEFGSRKYPNYINSLEVEKINGQVNKYKLTINYVISEQDDPNYFEKVFSSVSESRAITFTYGDLSAKNYIYRNEEAMITSVESSFNMDNASISYTVNAVSKGSLTLSGSYPFPASTKAVKPSSEILRILKDNETYGLQDLFTGMRNITKVEELGLIPTNDEEVTLEAQTNQSVLDRLQYLVACMTPAAATVTTTTTTSGKSSRYAAYLQAKAATPEGQMAAAKAAQNAKMSAAAAASIAAKSDESSEKNNTESVTESYAHLLAAQKKAAEQAAAQTSKKTTSSSNTTTTTKKLALPSKGNNSGAVTVTLEADTPVSTIQKMVNVTSQTSKVSAVSTSVKTTTTQEVARSSFYIIQFLDDTSGELDGPYFKIVQVDSALSHPEAYELNIGYPNSNAVTSFNVENNENYSIFYNYQQQLHPETYVRRLNKYGEYEDFYAPTLSSNNNSYETRENDKTWWTKVSQYPIKASVTIRGLLRPALLMSYIRLKVYFNGRRHINSGLYIITKQVDKVDESGYHTTIDMQRVGEDDTEGLE